MNSFGLRYPRVEWSRRSSDHHTQSSGSCLSYSIVVWWFRYTSSFFSSLSADADIGKIARGTRVRGVTVELAVQQVRELRLVDPRPVRFESSARVRDHTPPFAHDAADAPPGRGDAPPFQGSLDLPGAGASAAVAPDRAHVAGDRIHTLHPGTPGHPVTGGAGTPSIPHRADIGRRWPVSRLPSCEYRRRLS